MLILISDAFHESLPDRLKEFGEVTKDKDRVSEAEVVLIRSKTKCTREYLDAAPKLKLIIRGGVGLDNVDREYAKKKGIVVANTPAASSVAVAELAMALMLAGANKLIAGHQGLTEGQWLKKQLGRGELFKKTLGLLGIGRIGTEVAKRAKAFEMKVIAHDPYVKECDVAELVSVDDVISQSDFISLHMPLTDETRHMIDAAALAKTKAGVVFVNTGRGLCVDAEAMTKALEDGHVGCYATDVWPKDPPPEDYPLLEAPRTVMSPHIGASTQENLLRIGDIIVDKIQAHVAAKG